MKNHKYVADIAVAKISKNLEKLQELEHSKAPYPKSQLLINKNTKPQSKQETSATNPNHSSNTQHLHMYDMSFNLGTEQKFNQLTPQQHPSATNYMNPALIRVNILGLHYRATPG